MIDNPYRSDDTKATTSNDCTKSVCWRNPLRSVRIVFLTFVILLVLATVVHHKYVVDVPVVDSSSLLRSASKKNLRVSAPQEVERYISNDEKFGNIKHNSTTNYKIAELVARMHMPDTRTRQDQAIIASKELKMQDTADRAAMERSDHEEAERVAAAAERAAMERKAHEEAERVALERKAQEEAERVAAAAAETAAMERKAHEEAERVALERKAQEEAERVAAAAAETAAMEQKAHEEAERVAMERKAQEEAERVAAAAAETAAMERKAHEEAERMAAAAAETATMERKAHEEAERVAMERKALEEAERVAAAAAGKAATERTVESITNEKKVQGGLEGTSSHFAEGAVKMHAEVGKLKEKVVFDSSNKGVALSSSDAKSVVDFPFGGAINDRGNLTTSGVPVVSLSMGLILQSFLWLKSNEGVDVLHGNHIGQVTKWNDMSHNAKFSHRYFTSMSDDVTNGAYRDLVKLHRQNSIKHSKSDAKLPSNQFHALLRNIGKDGSGSSQPFVSFPCALVASDSNFHLEELSTFFFVIRPTYSGLDENSPGQTFFGHYPSGQFRLLNNVASFCSNGFDYVLPSGNGKIILNQQNILAFRFSGKSKVEISVNGSPFASARSASWIPGSEEPIFSHNSPLYIGGSTNHCGFVGDIFEVLGFQAPLSNEDVREVVEYLRRKFLLQEPDIAGSANSLDTATSMRETHRAGQNVYPSFSANDQKLPVGKLTEGAQSMPLKSTFAPPKADPPTNAVKYSDKTVHHHEAPPSRHGLNPHDVSPHNAVLGVINSPNGAKSSPLIQSVENSKVGKITTTSVVESSSRDTVSSVQSSGLAVGSAQHDICKSNRDPFKDTPVENFSPPQNADLKEVMMWEDAVTDLKDKIRKIKTGGKTLRDIIRKEVRTLQLLRFQTFCKYVSPTNT